MKPGQFSDGAWDCSHAYDPDMHRDAWRALGRPTDPEAAINVVERAWADNYDDGGQSWIEANGRDVISDSGGKVDPADEFRAWKAAWQSRAISYTARYMREWADRECPCPVCGGIDEGNTCCP